MTTQPEQDQWYFRKGWLVKINWQAAINAPDGLVWRFGVERLCKRGQGFTDGFEVTCNQDTFEEFRSAINQMIDRDLANIGRT